MAANPPDSTGFFFDVLRWRSSRDVHRMSMAERGVYLEMLLEQWERRTLPDDPQEIANAIAGSESQAQEVLAAWKTVRKKFVQSRGNPKLIFNEQLEETRKKQKENRQRRASSGRTAARARWGRDPLPPPSPSRVPSPSSGGEVVPMPPRQEPAPPPLEARSKHPIFTGQRLVVFDWMLENCMRLLGAHVDTFDLDAFFYALDGRLVADNLVVPKRETAQWLEGQVVEEAQRRGIDLRYVSTTRTVSRQTSMLSNALKKIRDEEVG